MNNHSRSFSLQPPSQISTTPAVGEPQSYIRFHSDSQQSLDQLFNPSQSAAKPLRHRNLPASFFKQSFNENGASPSNQSGDGTSDGRINNIHDRSISNPARLNLHMATRSTPAPMPRVLSNQSSTQSSRELLNYDPNVNRTNTSCSHHNQDHNHPHNNHCSSGNGHLSNGWSSVSSSTDNIAPSSNWVAGQPQSPITAVPIQQHQASAAQSQRTMMHQQANFTTNEATPMHLSNNQNAHTNTDTYHMQHPHNHHNNLCSNNNHARSISGLPIQPTRAVNITNVHPMRAHNISAPMQAIPAGISNANSHASSHQSSHEFLNLTNSMNHINSSATGWSSSGYSTDDLNSGWPTNGSVAPQPFAQQVQTVVSQQQIAPGPAPATAMVVHSHPQQTIAHHHHHNQHDPHHHHHHHNHQTLIESPHQHQAHVIHPLPHHHNHHDHNHVPMQQIEPPHIHPHHHHPHHHHHHHQAPQQVFYNA